MKLSQNGEVEKGNDISQVHQIVQLPGKRLSMEPAGTEVE